MAKTRLQDELCKRRPFDCLEQEVSLNLMRTQDQLGQPFQELFLARELTGPQYNVLRILRGHGPPGVPCHEIGGQMVARMPDVTRLVDRLETAGLAERTRTPSDRRVVLVRATQKGLELLTALDGPVIDLHRQLLVHMTRAELHESNRLLTENSRATGVRVSRIPSPESTPAGQQSADPAGASVGRPNRSSDMILRMFAALMATLTIAAAAPADSLKFNNTSSKIEFVGKKKDGSHNGGFKKFSGTMEVPDGDFSKAKVNVEIQIGSIFTDTEKLTTHLKSPDFFDARTYPKATFASTGIRPVAGDEGWSHLMTGDLTLHGVTKKVAIPVRVQKTETGLSLMGKVTIHGKDFGMTYGEGMVDNNVAITVTVQAGK